MVVVFLLSWLSSSSSTVVPFAKPLAWLDQSNITRVVRGERLRQHEAFVSLIKHSCFNPYAMAIEVAAKRFRISNYLETTSVQMLIKRFL